MTAIHMRKLCAIITELLEGRRPGVEIKYCTTSSLLVLRLHRCTYKYKYLYCCAPV